MDRINMNQVRETLYTAVRGAKKGFETGLTVKIAYAAFIALLQFNEAVYRRENAGQAQEPLFLGDCELPQFIDRKFCSSDLQFLEKHSFVSFSDPLDLIGSLAKATLVGVVWEVVVMPIIIPPLVRWFERHEQE